MTPPVKYKESRNPAWHLMKMRGFSYCVLFIVYGGVLTVESSFVQRYKSNLLLYSEYSTQSRKAAYTNSEQSDWQDLTQFIKAEGLPAKALLCGTGRGAWLAYPSANFQIGNSHAQLLIGDACIPAENINSAQPLGLITGDFNGLVTFSEVNFQSEAQLFEGEKGAKKEGVKSLMTMEGVSGEWTVEGGGQSVCLKRNEGVVSSGICILPDIPTQLNIADPIITMGCPENKENVIKLDIEMQTCFAAYGAYKLIDSYLKLPVISAVCQGSADQSKKLGFFKIVDAWKFRMNPDRQEEWNPADIDTKRTDEKNPMRMKMLTLFFAIFKDSCPTVPPGYFNLIRYIYMQHLKSIWEEKPEVVGDRNDTRFGWTVAYNFIESCWKHRQANPVVADPLESMNCVKLDPYESLNDDQSDAMDLFLQGDNLDPIIEQVWIMLNYVSPFCSNLDSLADNIWAEFVTLFRRQFLLPLLQQWINPGTWNVYYDFMFNGIPIEVGKRKIINCVQKLLSQTPYADPIDRPSATVSEFLNLSKKWPQIKPNGAAAADDANAAARKKRSFPIRHNNKNRRPEKVLRAKPRKW